MDGGYTPRLAHRPGLAGRRRRGRWPHTVTLPTGLYQQRLSRIAPTRLGISSRCPKSCTDEWWERGTWDTIHGSGAGPLQWTLPPAGALQGSNLREAAEEGNELGCEWDWQGACHTGLASSSQTHTSPHPEPHLLYFVPWPQLFTSSVCLIL